MSEAVWHDIECGAYTADFPLWHELVAAAPGQPGGICELLEIGCGTGRVSLALAGPHCRVTAVDSDPDLVEALRQRAHERGSPVDAVVADARSLELSSAFDVILAPMQLAQLLVEDDRLRLLSSIARHLRPAGRAALALLDLDEEWDAETGDAPVPDGMERDGWVYSSQPVAVRRVAGGSTLELDRVRRSVAPGGELTETFSRVCLELFSTAQLEAEARRSGFTPETRRYIPATEEHVASTVVILRRSDD